MKLVLLGSGGYYPAHGRHTACLALPEIGLVLDAGTGICRLGEYLDTPALDIVLSHVHLDHVVGLTYLLGVLPPAVLSETTLHGDPAKLEAVVEHLFAPEIFPVKPPFRLAPLTGPLPLAGGGTLEYFPLEHPGGSLGFRLHWADRSLAYITDTTAALGAAYVEKIRGVDLLVHECFFAQDVDDLASITGHSWLLPVAEVAAAAGVGRLVLAHLGPQIEDDSAFDLAAARRIFQNTQLGADGMELDF